MAQDKYIREVVSELGGKHASNKMVTVENVKRAFAIIDPAIGNKLHWLISLENVRLLRQIHCLSVCFIYLFYFKITSKWSAIYGGRFLTQPRT